VISRIGFRFVVSLAAVLVGLRQGTAREWIAALDQPCEGAPVCALYFEVVASDGMTVLASVLEPVEGCGTREVDISSMLNDLDLLGTEPPSLRVWSVSCEGVHSAEFDWVLIEAEPRCAGRTRSTGDGDANGDNDVDISDAICIADYLFLGGPRPCMNTADANNDAVIDLSDAIYILLMLFG